MSSNNNTVDYFNPQIASVQDYYPFGMLQPGRSFNAGGYRYGFNGKENDNEVKGEGNQQDYGMRVYDPRLGKFLSVDPLTRSYPWYTPYHFAGNKPINSIDLDGLVELVLSNVVDPVNPQAPGSADLSITINYNVVTQGLGAVADNRRINPNAITRNYDDGDGVFRMRNLPTAGNPAVFLTAKENRLARKAEGGDAKAILKLTNAGLTYYRVNVDYYNVTVTNNPNVMLQDAQAQEQASPRRNGIIICLITIMLEQMISLIGLLRELLKEVNRQRDLG